MKIPSIHIAIMHDSNYVVIENSFIENEFLMFLLLFYSALPCYLSLFELRRTPEKSRWVNAGIFFI